MVPSVEKKVALVTGGGTGVGKAVCLALAQLDYSIAVNYSRSELDAQSVCSTIRKSGGKAIPVRCDVGKSSDVQHMVNTILDVFGRVDCLVCNAGTTHFVDYLDLNKIVIHLNNIKVIYNGIVYEQRASSHLLGLAPEFRNNEDSLLRDKVYQSDYNGVKEIKEFLIGDSNVEN